MAEHKFFKLGVKSEDGKITPASKWIRSVEATPGDHVKAATEEGEKYGTVGSLNAPFSKDKGDKVVAYDDSAGANN